MLRNGWVPKPSDSSTPPTDGSQNRAIAYFSARLSCSLRAMRPRCGLFVLAVFGVAPLVRRCEKVLPRERTGRARVVESEMSF